MTSSLLMAEWETFVVAMPMFDYETFEFLQDFASFTGSITNVLLFDVRFGVNRFKFFWLIRPGYMLNEFSMLPFDGTF